MINNGLHQAENESSNLTLVYCSLQIPGSNCKHSKKRSQVIDTKMKLHLVILTVALTWTTGVTAKNQLHLEGCSYNEQAEFCNRNAGLYCNPENSVCECLQGELDTKYNYTMEWDGGLSRCVGTEGSACVGTSGTPTVACRTGLVCTQIVGYVESVGICSVPAATSPTPAPGGAFGLQFSVGLITLLSLARLSLSF
ncbi:unnamed protein product [Allacma fusca]|uniref:Uncharacterized protein n=1 Tax=Allacma fusca TaxID=39272 RepID=A0A8J2KS84_9HEXA|nr:unnamed protein product [Allacma fusca]